jgi:uncharacterized protein YndB with AHSA1/START domain
METANDKTREISLSRLLQAPVALVWEVFSSPDHLGQWWGPDGFSNTIKQMDLRAGGEFELVMHGPDGKDYYNLSVFEEIVPLKKIVYRHVSEPVHLTTITFTAQGDQTLLTWHMLFGSEEKLSLVIRTYRADAGLIQNVERLRSYLNRMATGEKQL